MYLRDAVVPGTPTYEQYLRCGESLHLADPNFNQNHSVDIAAKVNGYAVKRIVRILIEHEKAGTSSPSVESF